MKNFYKTAFAFVTSIASITSLSAYADEPYNFSSSNAYQFGIEGFRDVYREPGAGLDVSDYSKYGSLTGNYTHYWGLVGDERIFAGLDGRASFGTDHYHSDSGEYSGALQMEFDIRALGGIEYNHFLGGSGALSPYTGLGLTYFRDDAKGKITNTGAYGYDRRLDKIYIPVGLTYNYPFSDEWSLKPTMEADILLGGTVQTRLQNIPGYQEVENSQNSGYGLRGELLAGWKHDALTWEAGPFVRYWNIRDSNTSCASNSLCGLEPNNTRLQYGAEIKLLW